MDIGSFPSLHDNDVKQVVYHHSKPKQNNKKKKELTQEDIDSKRLIE
jgi:hypothetical protein